MTAGLDAAKGQAVILLDADLQDPPELIPDMVAQWQDGYDVVDMQRRTRQGESVFKRGTAWLFYKLINRLSDISIPENVGDFRLLDRRVVDEIRKLPERTRFMKGLFAWPGFRRITLQFDRDPRLAGSTKWNCTRLVNLAVEGITSFSTRPLRLATAAGVITAISALVMAAVVFAKTLIWGDPVAGYPSMLMVILLLGSIQLLSIGLMGEYIGRLFIEAKQRPLYIVRDVSSKRLPPSSINHDTIKVPDISMSRSAFSFRTLSLCQLALLVISISLLIRLVSLAIYPLMDTTEARYGEMARIMAETGNWVTPMFDYNVPFWGKPPLFSWLSAGGITLLGNSEFAVRAPHLLVGAAVVFLTFVTASQTGRNRSESLLAAAILSSTAAFIVISGAVMTDTALTLGITLSMMGFWLAWQNGSRLCGYLFFVGLAIGMLAKGPLTLVLAGISITLWSASEGRWKVLHRKLPWVKGSLLFAAVTLPGTCWPSGKHRDS